VQEALTHLAQRWSAVARRGDPEPYVRRVLYTRAVDGWRRRRRRPEVLSPDVPDRPELRGCGDEPEAVTRRIVLADALARLTPRQRAVLVLRYYEDLPEADVARILGVTVGTVRSQAAKGLATMRRVRAAAEETA